jgi:molybdate transport system substrate-binding protein
MPRLIAYALLVTLTFWSASMQAQTLTVFAAASMKNALDDANAAFAQASGIKIVASYAASSALARQLENGAPADVFVSADLDWMDYAAQKKLIQDGSRVDLLRNALVLIAPATSTVSDVTVGPDLDLPKLLGNGRLVTGDVRAVPAGKYAKTALEKLGLWAKIENKIAMAENVRAALALVAREEAPLGIVYATDAKVEPRVRIVGVFPEDSHPPITYPIAATINAKPEATHYLAFLRADAARSILERYGFKVLPAPAS